MKLIIIQDIDKVGESSVCEKEITYEKFKYWIRTGSIFCKILKFSRAELYVKDIKKMYWPLPISIFMKVICRGRCEIKDANHEVKEIAFRTIAKETIEYIRERIAVKELKKNIDQNLQLFSHKKYNKTNIVDKTKVLNSVIYLRTEHWDEIQTGGAVSHTTGVLNNFSKLLDRTVYISSVSVPGIDPNIEIHNIDKSYGYRNFHQEERQLAHNGLFFKEAEKIIADDNYAFIYQRYCLNNYCGAQLAEKLKIPFVLEYNGSEVWVSNNWGRKVKNQDTAEKIEWFNLISANLIVVVSSPLKDQIVAQGISEEKILINPNGVDPEKYSPSVCGDQIREEYSLGNKIVFGFIGTFGPWHGAEILVKSFGMLMKKCPEYQKRIHLMMIGDGVTMESVKKLVDDYCLYENVSLTGLIPHNEGPTYLAACDILVSPHVPNSDGSPFFGSPTKLFEYMAIGKPIVASDLDQIGEILKHDETAHLVTPGDSNALCEGLKHMIENPSSWEKMGQLARQECLNKYTWKSHTEKILEKLAQICN